METERQTLTPARASTAHVWPASLRRWRNAVWRGLRTRWPSVAAVAGALVAPVVVIALRGSLAEAAHAALGMALTSLVSIALVGMASWLIRHTGPHDVRLSLATPMVLTALVIALNAALLGHLMFLSREDTGLLLTFLAFSMALAFALTSPMAGHMVHTIRRIDHCVERIASGEYAALSAEDDPKQAQELIHLARSIDQLAASMQDAVEGRQAAEAHRRGFVSAVSHDLRTPLSCVQAMVEAIVDGVVVEPAAVHQYHEKLRAEVRRLTALVEELFELTRLEAGALAIKRERMLIQVVLAEAVEAIRERAEQAHIHVSHQVDGILLPVTIDAGQIYRVLTELLENALRYTLPGGAILVRAMTHVRADQKQGVLIEVIDTGEGIAEHDLAHIFEPAYRGVRAILNESRALERK